MSAATIGDRLMSRRAQDTGCGYATRGAGWSGPEHQCLDMLCRRCGGPVVQRPYTGGWRPHREGWRDAVAWGCSCRCRLWCRPGRAGTRWRAGRDARPTW